MSIHLYIHSFIYSFILIFIHSPSNIIKVLNQIESINLMNDILLVKVGYISIRMIETDLVPTLINKIVTKKCKLYDCLFL